MSLRRFVIILLCLAFMLSACKSGPAVQSGSRPTEGSVALEPARSVNDEPFTIALLPQYTDEVNGSAQRRAQESMLDQVQQYVNSLGWQITLSIMDYDHTDPTKDNVFDKIRFDITSGKIADGYQVNSEPAKKLLSEGLTQDAGALCKKFAPQLYDRLQVLQNGAAGIPLRLLYWPKGRPTVLYMDESVLDSYREQISNADDLMAFLESGQRAILADNTKNYDIWAAQQGYYELSLYGLPTFFYARVDDPDCTPVPLEQIAGFRETFRRMSTLEHNGNVIRIYRIKDERQVSGNVCGYLGPLTRQLSLQFLQLTGKSGAEYAAIPLQGCTAPVMDADDPYISRMLAIPARSDHGDAVASFCQWALASPDGYSLINYGAQDEDYQVTDRGIKFLKGGMPLSAADWKEYNIFTLPAMCTIQGSIFYSDDLERQSVYEADGTDDLILKTQPLIPPIWKISELRGFNTTTEPFDDIISQYQDTLDVRYKVLFPSYTEMQGDTILSEQINQQLDLLKTLEESMEELSLKLKERLAFMMP